MIRSFIQKLNKIPAYLNWKMDEFIFYLIKTKSEKESIQTTIKKYAFLIKLTGHKASTFNNIDLYGHEKEISKEKKSHTKIYKPHLYGDDKPKEKYFLEKEVRIKHFTNSYVYSRTSLVFDENKTVNLEYNYTNSNYLVFKDLYINGVINDHVLYKNIKAKEIKIEKGISLLGKGSWNYFHMMFEYLPKLAYIQEDISDYTILVDADYKNYDAFKYLIPKIFKGDICYIANDESVFVQNLIYVTTPFYLAFNKTCAYELEDMRYNNKIIDWIKKLNLILEKDASIKAFELKKYKKIFLTRDNNKSRNYNSEEIAKIAQDHGFQMVDLSNHTLLEQYLIMKNVDFFIGPTGASLTNIIFCKAGTTGITWMHDAWGDFPVYSTLSKIVGIELRYLKVESRSERYSGEYHLESNYFLRALENINAAKKARMH